MERNVYQYYIIIMIMMIFYINFTEVLPVVEFVLEDGIRYVMHTCIRGVITVVPVMTFTLLTFTYAVMKKQ